MSGDCFAGKCGSLVRLTTFDGVENWVCTDCGTVQGEVYE